MGTRRRGLAMTRSAVAYRLFDGANSPVALGSKREAAGNCTIEVIATPAKVSGTLTRSQGNRVLSRVEKFRHVMLAFSGVEFVGQAFADEVFRVFALQHPDMELIPIHTNSEIGQMISRATAGRKMQG